MIIMLVVMRIYLDMVLTLCFHQWPHYLRLCCLSGSILHEPQVPTDQRLDMLMSRPLSCLFFSAVFPAV